MRDQTNTSIFIIAGYPLIAQPEYRDNLAKTIITCQGLQFEPYVVSPSDELLAESNLFIKLPDVCVPLEMTRDFWKENNLFLMDDALFDRLDLAEMLVCQDYFRIFADSKLRPIAVFFCKNDTDWIAHLRKIVWIRSPNIIKSLIVLKESHRIKLPCVTTTS